MCLKSSVSNSFPSFCVFACVWSKLLSAEFLRTQASVPFPPASAPALVELGNEWVHLESITFYVSEHWRQVSLVLHTEAAVHTCGRARIEEAPVEAYLCPAESRGYLPSNPAKKQSSRQQPLGGQEGGLQRGWVVGCSAADLVTWWQSLSCSSQYYEMPHKRERRGSSFVGLTQG